MSPPAVIPAQGGTRLVVIAGLVPAIHFAEAWTTGTSPVVTIDRWG